MASALDMWIERINQGEMALLAGVVRRMQAIVADDDASMAKISQTILSDAGLTSKVLKMANSVTYTQQSGSVTTVSRASILLGVETLRNLSLSVRIVDDLLSRSKQQPLLRVLALSLQTAVLSRHLCARDEPRKAEEVFIAGLLMDLGEAAYFSLGDPSTVSLLALWQKGIDRDQACLQIMGVTFRELGRGLAHSWNLGGVALEVMSPMAESRLARMVGCCHGIAECVLTGRDQDRMQALYAQLAKLMNRPLTAMIESVEDALEQMPNVINEYGAEALLGQFHEVQDSEQIEEVVTAAHETVAEIHQQRLPDVSLQLGILREMSLLEEPRSHINTLVSMALEGLYRGVALDRVLVAVLSADGKVLSARTALGTFDPLWRDAFRFNLRQGELPVFAEVMSQRQARWLGQDAPWNAERLGAGADRILNQGVHSLHALAGPLLVGGRAVGIIYADCQPSRRALSIEDFNAFRHFMHQLNLPQQQAIVKP
ncbi:MAG: HDOD domain-containing protein [Pseudomonadales bacterium]|nr:HDOD domain-containing protein [Pseudomonadales bacterium]